MTTPGRYYFCPEDTPFVEGIHHYGSKDWLDHNHILVQDLGEDLGFKSKWDNGQPPVDLPNNTVIGDEGCLESGEHISQALDPRKLYDGFNVLCFVPQGQPTDPFPLVSEFLSCGLQFFYATCMNWSYLGLAHLIETAFTMLLGFTPQVRFHPQAGTMPGVTTVIAPTFSVAIINGTDNFQQLAQQAMELLQGPANIGIFSTLPVWYTASDWVHNWLTIDGAEPTAGIMLVGHSYGAVVASLLAARYFMWLPKRRIRLLTFGCPKPGDERLRRILFEVPAMQLANDNDPVTSCAPDLLLTTPVALALAAPSLLIWDTWDRPPYQFLMDDTGALTPNADALIDFTTLLNWATTILAHGPLPPVSGHLITVYRDRIFQRCPFPEWPIDPDTWRFLLQQGIAQIDAGAQCVFDGPPPDCGWFELFGGDDEPVINPSGHGVDFIAGVGNSAETVIYGSHLIKRVDASLLMLSSLSPDPFGIDVCVNRSDSPTTGLFITVADDGFNLFGGTGSFFLGLDGVFVPDMFMHTLKFTVLLDRAGEHIRVTLTDVTAGLSWTLNGDGYFSPPFSGDLSGPYCGMFSFGDTDSTWTLFKITRVDNHISMLDRFNDAPGIGLYEHTPNYQQDCTGPFPPEAELDAGAAVVGSASKFGPGSAAIDAGALLAATGSAPRAAAAAIDAGAVLAATGGAPQDGDAAIDAGVDLAATGSKLGFGSAAIDAGADLVATGAVARAADAALDAGADLAATGAVARAADAAIDAGADLAATGAAAIAGSAAIDAGAVVSATG